MLFGCRRRRSHWTTGPDAIFANDSIRHGYVMIPAHIFHSPSNIIMFGRDVINSWISAWNLELRSSASNTGGLITEILQNFPLKLAQAIQCLPLNQSNRNRSFETWQSFCSQFARYHNDKASLLKAGFNC